jgi:hypothetical protein
MTNIYLRGIIFKDFLKNLIKYYPIKVLVILVMMDKKLSAADK